MKARFDLGFYYPLSTPIPFWFIRAGFCVYTRYFDLADCITSSVGGVVYDNESILTSHDE